MCLCLLCVLLFYVQGRLNNVVWTWTWCAYDALVDNDFKRRYYTNLEISSIYTVLASEFI